MSAPSAESTEGREQDALKKTPSRRARSEIEERILVLAPTSNDARLTRTVP